MKNIIKFENFTNENKNNPPSGSHGHKITVKGFDFIVNGDYISGEDAVMYQSDGGGYPGSPSEFDISSYIIAL